MLVVQQFSGVPVQIYTRPWTYILGGQYKKTHPVGGLGEYCTLTGVEEMSEAWVT